MSTVRITIEWPAGNANKRPISHARIESRADPSLPWAAINSITFPETELLITNIGSGTWEYQGIVVDDIGQESSPLSTTVDIPFETPDPLVSITAVAE